MRQILRGAVVVVLLGLVGGSGLAAARLLAPLPRPGVWTVAPSTWTPLPGEAAPVTVPAVGSLAVDASDDEGTRTVTRSDAATVRPIASVTKTMTAMVVLEQRPLAPGESGPVLTMTAADEADYRSIAAAGGSVAPVYAGERLTERQLLLGLMLPSANNMALTLARWVDGSVAAFVGRLNRRAAELAMRHTHFADPDGLAAATVSTADDLVLLGEHVVADPGFVDIVATQSATLPDGTVIHNLDALLGSQPGWIGIKTGWTPQAGGCLLFAARRTPDGGTRPVTVVGAVLAQPPDAAADRAHPELGSAVRVAREAVDTVLAGYAAVTLGSATLPVSGTLRDPGGGVLSAVHVTGAPRTVVLRDGEVLALRVATTAVEEPVPAGAVVATVTVTRGTAVLGTWQLATDTAVPGPSAAERLLHW